MRRAHLLLSGLAAAALVAPATAAADVTVSLSGGTLTITGSSGDDDIALGPAGSNALGPTTRVSGGGQTMVAGAGCQGFGDPNGPANDDSVFCPTDAIARLRVDLLGGDDAFGGGNLETVVNGGPGEDEITIGATGSDGVNTVDGGADDDTIDVGRAGAADSIAGGAGVDTVSHASHSAVVVSLDGVANDGTGAEGDDVKPDVERLIGTSGADTLIGSAGPNTLDGAGGTDRLEGLGGADTLIGGPGTNDATFGGEGDDAIMLRDGLADACPSGGPGANTFDLDLVDQSIIIGTGTRFPRCIFPRIPIAPLTPVNFGAVDEGPNVRMTAPAPVVRAAGVRARLSCPAALRAPCAGRLRVFAGRAVRPLGVVAYSVAPGRATVVVVPLAAGPRATARAAGLLRLVSVERGRSKLGPKTTLLLVTQRPR